MLVVLQNFLGLLSWFFLGNFYRAEVTQALTKYNMDFISYILLGVFFSRLIVAGSGTMIHFKVYDPAFRLMYMSRIDPLRFTIISLLFQSFAYTLPELMLQFFILFAIFKIYVPSFIIFAGGILIALYTAVVNFIFYLSVDSLILHIPALRTSNYHPVREVISLLTAIIDGRYYPVEVLPQFLRFFIYFFPSSNGLLAIRLYMAGSSEYLYHLFALTILALVFTPITRGIIRKGIDRVRSEGFVMSPLR